MADKPIEEKVKDIIVEQLGVNPEQVTSNASFIEDLGADSLDIVELVMAFEEEFSVEVPDEDAEKLQTVGDVSNISRNERNRRNSVGEPRRGLSEKRYQIFSRLRHYYRLLARCRPTSLSDSLRWQARSRQIPSCCGRHGRLYRERS